jgi:hypothetical protein
MRRRIAAAAAGVLLAALGACGSTARADTSQPVTVIGDSILTAVEWNAQPLAILLHGLDVQLDIAICRRIAGQSCPFQGSRAPTLMDVVQSMGPALGKVVLVEVGYNDPTDVFGDEVEEAIDAMRAAGVQKILWANMRALNPQFQLMDDELKAAAARHPSLVRIVDWDAYSRGHNDWFQSDAAHLLYNGAIGMATLFNEELTAAVAAPLTIRTHTLEAPVDEAWSGRIVVTGGVPPYRWHVLGHRLPHGLHLLAGGELVGEVTRPTTIRLRVDDAFGNVAQATLRLTTT